MYRNKNIFRRYCLPSMLLALIFFLAALCGCGQATESMTGETTEDGGDKRAAVSGWDMAQKEPAR